MVPPIPIPPFQGGIGLAARMIDSSAYAPWDEDLKDFIAMVRLEERWPGLKIFFRIA